MSDFNRDYARTIPADRADMSVDAGLRSFMLGVYNKMALGLVLSAALAWLTADFPPVQQLLYRVTPDGHLIGFTSLGLMIRFLPLVVLIGAMFIRNPSPRAAGAVYWSVVSGIGAGLGIWLLAYTGVSVATTFLITATSFGALSLVGYTTKRDLTGMGSFLIMGVLGLLGAMVINIFIQSSMMAFIVSLAGVGIFAGLTAFHTQRLKLQYYQLGGDQTALSVATNYGALQLYLDFLNLFQFMLSLMGGRR